LMFTDFTSDTTPEIAHVSKTNISYYDKEQDVKLPI